MFWRRKKLKPKQKKRIELLGSFYKEAIIGYSDETKVAYDEKLLIYHKGKFEGACEALDLKIENVNGINFNVYKSKNKVVEI